MSEVLAQGWELDVDQTVRGGSLRTLSRVREEIRFPHFHFFLFPATQIAQLLHLSPSAISRKSQEVKRNTGACYF